MLFSQSIAESEAQSLAESFLSTTNVERMFSGTSTRGRSVDSLSSRFSNLYIFNSDSGWVIIPEDKRVQPILAFSYENTLDDAENNEQFLEILDWYNEGIQYIKDSANLPIHPQWLSRGRDLSIFIEVAPLLRKNGHEVVWNQYGNNTTNNNPAITYNKFCPPCGSSPTGHCMTGCVPVALGQLMWYWEWPQIGYVKDESGTGYTQHYYDWSLMPYQLTNESSVAEANEIARLLYDIGRTDEVEYGCEGTGDRKTPFVTLESFFGYTGIQVHSITSGQDISVLVNPMKLSLMHRMPVIFTGYRINASGNRVGHCFIVDGCTTDGHFYINYGWGGSGNGYYSISEFIYSINPQIYTNIYPRYIKCEAISLGQNDFIREDDFFIPNAGSITLNNVVLNGTKSGTIKSSEAIRLMPGTRLTGRPNRDILLGIENLSCDHYVPYGPINRFAPSAEDSAKTQPASISTNSFEDIVAVYDIYGGFVGKSIEHLPSGFYIVGYNCKKNILYRKIYIK